jgi:8-oxo-dGTP pyrophosphatase MutT (NUDIX family)
VSSPASSREFRAVIAGIASIRAAFPWHNAKAVTRLLENPPMSPVAIPSRAATLVLLRDQPGRAVETLLVKRHSRSRFAGGDYVFAGGKVEANDMPADAERFCRGLGAEEAARRLGGGLPPRDALGFWVGAIREAFEEVGLLLAYGSDGTPLAFEPGARERFAAHRAACQASNRAFFEVLRAEGLTLATDRLVYFAHWITPEENPIRFDTRFFAAPAPGGQEPDPDGHEIVDARWLVPAEALAARERGEISLRTPTMKNLELLTDGGSAATVLAALERRPVRTIRPRVLTVDGQPVPVLPGDPRWY